MRLKSLTQMMRGLRASPLMKARAAALRFLQAKVVVGHYRRPRGMHPEVVLAFHRAMRPIVRRRSVMPSTSRGKNWLPNRWRMVSSREYWMDKHGSLRRRNWLLDMVATKAAA